MATTPTGNEYSSVADTSPMAMLSMERIVDCLSLPRAIRRVLSFDRSTMLKSRGAL